MVWDADLGQAPASSSDLDEQLRGEERAGRLEADALQRLASEELAGTVHVAHRQSVEEAQAQAVGSRVGEPDGRVGSPEAIADDDIGPVGRLRPRQEARQVGDTELAVAVGEGDERMRGSREATP